MSNAFHRLSCDHRGRGTRWVIAGWKLRKGVRVEEIKTPGSVANHESWAHCAHGSSGQSRGIFDFLTESLEGRVITNERFHEYETDVRYLHCLGQIHGALRVGLAAVVIRRAALGRAAGRMFAMLLCAGKLFPRMNKLPPGHDQKGGQPEDAEIFQTEGHDSPYRQEASTCQLRELFIANFLGCAVRILRQDMVHDAWLSPSMCRIDANSAGGVLCGQPKCRWFSRRDGGGADFC